MKRKIALLLGLILLCSNTLIVSAEENLYSDTKVKDWFYSSLSILSDNNIITGYDDGTFKPQRTLSIDQYTAILTRLIGEEISVTKAPGVHWAQNYIDFADKEGWYEGLDITDYEAPINRLQAATLTVKAIEFDIQKSPEELEKYQLYIDDFDDIPLLYRVDVLFNYAIGITNGYPNGEFQGKNTLTRAEAAVISHRVFEPSMRRILLDPDKTADVKELLEEDNIGDYTELEGEVSMPNNVFVYNTSNSSATNGSSVTISGTGLIPEVGHISENILADTIIELSDQKSTNKVSGGYNYGLYNINLLSEDNDSLLIYTASDGSKTITIDLMLMVDSEGNILPDASDLLLLISKNIDIANGETLFEFIIDSYNDRESIPEDGLTINIGGNDIKIIALVHDHNIVKVEITVP